MIGIAICDSQLRYVSVNNALAAMNGIPAEAHVGKTVREILGRVASTVELMLNSVLLTGQSLLNAEVMGELPTRNEEGHWIENYFPIHDSNGGVKQVGVLVVEITELRKLENSIVTLMGNVPRTRSELTYLGKPYGLEKESIEWWRGSIETVERSVLDILKNPHALRPPAQMSDIGGVVTQQRVRLPHAHSGFPNERFGNNLGSRLSGNDRATPLSPREIEIVQLLAGGKSNKEISAALRISVKTVESHRARILLKLNIHSASDLVLYAVRRGIVKP
jgi:DNA-binding CsgD family transcriptional regulator